ncbi:MAG: rubredoxin [Dethiobacteria bacterium]
MAISFIVIHKQRGFRAWRPRRRIVPGITFEDLPDDSKCPICFVG